MSIRAIKTHMKKGEKNISIGSISHILNSKGLRRESAKNGVPVPPKCQPCSVRSSKVIQKVALLVKKENPLSQREIAKRTGVSARTVRRIIHEDLGKVTRKKALVHVLKPKHVQNRKTNCRKLYETKLAGQKSEFAVTLDEALFYLQDCNGIRRICYVDSPEEVEKFVVEKQERFGDKFMVVGARRGRGVLPLVKVPKNVKINAEWYIGRVLKPLLEVEVPKLYGEDTHKVFVHHDAASSHTAWITTAYAQDLKQRLGITIISSSDIPVKSPDTSPMDFYGFGFLKQRLQRRRPRTLEGVWKALKEEWGQVSLETVQSVFESWKFRLRLVSKRGGKHIEQTRAIHTRKM